MNDILTVQENALDEQSFYNLFAEFDALEPFDIKKEELAAQLTALLSYSKTTRSDFAQLSGWQKSTVTAVLNGKRNPTFKTLWEFARYLGYEADLVFREPNELTARQPWQPKECQSLHFQRAEKVILDVEKGCHYEFYVGFNLEPMFSSVMRDSKPMASTTLMWFTSNEN
ncbi:MAG: helix-turn-helix transcriptional regulator [Methylococcales bacterium]